MATKQQEREALDKIAEIIKGLGQDSYIAAAFDGCLDMAEDNIGNDFMCSMKARAEDAQQEVASLLVENREKAARANLWNSEHAQIEVRTDINQSFVAGWFRKAADDLSVTIEWNKLHFGEDCQDVKRELKTEAHLRAVAARLSGNVRSLHFIGTDDLSREVFVDELGTVWKYTEPGSMPRERHDKLYAASSNDRDGEPGLPMSDAFDYQIIYEGQEA